jgi:hypothetical protein
LFFGTAKKEQFSPQRRKERKEKRKEDVVKQKPSLRPFASFAPLR